MLGFIKQLFRPQFLMIVVAALLGIYYKDIFVEIQKFTFWWPQDQVDVLQAAGEEKLYTKQQLATYNGVKDAPIYLAILGCVYDVSTGSKHYGPGGAYNYFVGRDASVSFISGEFEQYDETAADDVLTLKKEDLLALANWKSFYDKQYIYKGKLVGRFYSSSGAPTAYYHEFMALVEQAQETKADTEQLRKRFPDCNIEWSPNTGTRVWCTNFSGGQKRTWVGYPRKLFQIGNENFRCACVQEENFTTSEVMLQAYDNCPSRAHECYYQVD